MFIPNPTIEKVIAHCDQDKLNLMLIAEHTSIDYSHLIDTCNRQGYHLAGGIFPMLIYKDDSFKEGIIIKKIEAEVHLVQDIGADFGDQLPELGDAVKSCLTLVDGLSGDIPNFLDTLYTKYWNQISYVGGGAGSLTLVQKPCLFTNEGFFENAGLLVMTSWETRLGVKHGWEKIEGPFVANKAQGNRIIELNWKPAYEVYKEVVERNSHYRFADADFFEISKGFPFGITREKQEDVVRDPISVDEEGALVCVGKVDQNTVLNILRGENEKLIKSASEAALESTAHGVKDVFVADCISRILYLEEDFKNELIAIKISLENIGDIPPLEGILSIGEISSGINGYLELYNKTIVVASFY